MFGQSNIVYARKAGQITFNIGKNVIYPGFPAVGWFYEFIGSLCQYENIFMGNQNTSIDACCNVNVSDGI